MDWGWITKTLIAPAIIAVAGWVWGKVTDRKRDDAKQEQESTYDRFERTIRGAIESILAEIVDHVPSQAPVEAWLKGARDYVEKRIWAALAKRGIPRNAVTDQLVHMLLEECVAELGKKISAERRQNTKGT